jgi:hypothetical protein
VVRNCYLLKLAGHNHISMRAIKIFKITIPALFLALFSCIDTEKESVFGWSESEYEIAIPIVSTKVTVSKIADVSKGNTGIRISPDGKATVIYNGEVIRRTSAVIFPPFPGLFPYPIEDTLFNIKIIPNNNYLLKKAVFQDTKISFSFENVIPQDVKIKMRILELTKNGQRFERDFTLKYNNSLPSKLQTEQISIDGWTLQSESNSLTFSYEAVLQDGRKIVLDRAQMNFDVIKFSYLEGYLGYHVIAESGSIIDIGLFNKWLSGSFDFEDPKITIGVDNSFGLPVRSNINKMELTSITGKRVNLESTLINVGFDFAYPSFSEIGAVKRTFFEFNKNNSNIREVFNEKTKTIAYDISAIVNPARDTTIKGFITSEGYFLANVAVEVPLNGSVNQLVVTDTLDIDLADFEEVRSAEFKAITSNDFPADMMVQAFFLDESGKKIDALFNGDGLTLSAASIQSNGKTTPGAEKTDYIIFDQERFEKIRKSKRLVLSGRFNTTGSDIKQSLWIYDTYGLGLKLGAKIKYRKN